MDFILKRINRMVDISEHGGVEHLTYLRERIEYILFFLLGYLWGQSDDSLIMSNKDKIILNLNKISIGQVIEAIRWLDADNTLMIKKKKKNILDSYPTLRNRTIGHGYTHDDKIQEITDEFEQLYEELVENIKLLQEEIDIIQLEGEEGENFRGFRYDCKDGLPQRWSCPKELIYNAKLSKGEIYICIGEQRYIKISPYIHIVNKGEGIYVFNSLVEKLTGKIKYSNLFKTEDIYSEAIELIGIAEEEEYRKKSPNGTIINYFEQNYSSYIDMGLKSTVKRFLAQNVSSVCATLWGHGGVGKTACIQSVCLDLFNDFNKVFDYIIFVSAKDRMYNTKTGCIEQLQNIRTFEEILATCIKVTYGEDVYSSLKEEKQIEDNINKLLRIHSRMLLVIDDYETFNIKEKNRIDQFIKKLDINKHKVIITTRVNKLVIGEAIPTNEFTSELTKDFLIKIFETDYKEYLKELKKILSDDNILTSIQKATSGRPIFIYQFAYLYVRCGLKKDILEKLNKSENAKEFLYGRIYDYLSSSTKDTFVCISQVVNNENLMFKRNVLEYLLKKNTEDDDILFERDIDELQSLRIIENYDAEYYRVYSKEIADLMKEYYSRRDAPFKDTVKNRLDVIGGGDIAVSIYEAMFSEANKSRDFSNQIEVEDRYRRILNDNKCPYNIRKKVLINLVSYLSNQRLDGQSGIKVIKDYFNKFKTDRDIVKLYAQLLWSNEEDRVDACKVLVEYIGKNKKNRPENLELFAITVAYVSANKIKEYIEVEKEIIDNQIPKSDEKVIKREQNNLSKCFNEYGRKLFELIKNNKFVNYKPAVRHSIIIGLTQSLKICVELSKQDENMSNYGLNVCKYCLDNFPDKFKIQVEKLRNEISNNNRKSKIWLEFINNNKEGDKIEAEVIYLKRYGAIVNVNNNIKGLIPISQIADRYIFDIGMELKVHQKVKAKITKINNIDKNIELSITQCNN